MATDVLMPQMGESVAEGTIVRWIKQVGEAVDRDEPLFEISTDKVDAEVPSPVGGVVAQIRADVGETVPINTVVAVIDKAGEPVSEASLGSAAPGAPPTQALGVGTPLGAETAPRGGAAGASRLTVAAKSGRQYSPVVRRLAAEHDVDLALVEGTGDGGRVSKTDVMAFVEARVGKTSPSLALPQGRAEPMSVMRQRIAQHMLESRRTSAHVHTVFEVDFSRVATARAAHTGGQTPSYLSYIATAVADALVAMPVVNASIDGDNVVYHDDVNLGIAVALDWGLIVPVIKQADTLGVDAIDQMVRDLAERARAKQLSPDEGAGGTYTITNPGGFGSVMGMPIINQPQVAILAVGAVEQRPVVVDDGVVPGLRGFLTLGFDHRLIDGAVADQFVARVKQMLESW
ncbi:MAG: dihydrolipoamide acetyltransferase family protein [Acidobacteriota bacterium]|nr:dihydrolipoamide acetyltransferase family protein [Acidobacteriota bacterium]